MTIIKTRTDTAANFTAANTVLAAGERAIESDTLKEKVGPGAWNSLAYLPTGGAALQTGSLSPSTSLAATPTQVINHVQAQLSALVNSAPGALDTLEELAAALGDDANFAATIANTLATKAPGGALIAYAGTGRALAATDNGNIIRCTYGSPVTMTVPAGLPAGFSCAIVQGGAGTVTVAASGTTLTPSPGLATDVAESQLLIAPAGTNAYTVYSPVAAGAGSLAALSDMGTYDLGVNNPSVAAIKATAEAALAGGAVLCVVTGTRGTGNTLSASLATGYAGTFQWQSKVAGTWTNISGATAQTYVEGSGEAARDIRCVFTPTSFATNTLAAPGVSAPVFTASNPPDGNVGTAYSYSYVATGAVSYAVASGSLPAGLSLNTATGAITGTPTTAATSTFVISATNSGGTTNASSQDVVIGAASAYITPSLEYADGSMPDITNANVYDDFIVAWSSANSLMRKDDSAFGSPIGLLSAVTDTNINASTGGSLDDGTTTPIHLPHVAWPYASGGDSGGTYGQRGYEPTTPGTLMKREFDAPATAGQQNTLHISAAQRRYEYGDTSTPVGFRVVLTPSDGSVAPVTFDVSGTVADYGYFGGVVKVDYKPNTTGTLHVSIQELPTGPALHGTGSYAFGFQAVLLKTNT